MDLQFIEHCEYEANAQFDYIREAYAASALDPEYEGYCSYCDGCEQEGVEPLGFEAWRKELRAPRPAVMPTYADTDEIPF
jgi:hypothetical protein